MSKVTKIIVRNVIIIVVLLLLASPLWIKLLPITALTPILGHIEAVDNYLCTYTIRASGESMDPIIPVGTGIDLDKCFSEDDIHTGTIVLFSDGSDLRLGIVRYILELTPKVYKISNEINPDQFKDKVLSDISAISNGVDTSATKFVAALNAEDFYLDHRDYYEYFFIASIPRDEGIDSTTPVETTTFSYTNDQFCTLVKPYTTLSNFSVEIVNNTTNEVTPFFIDAILEPQDTANIECRQLGSNEGQLNISPGYYYVRVSKDHQTLEAIDFVVE